MALLLVSLVMVSVAYNSSAFSPHTKLLESIDAFERAVRFSRDEAVLRNRIIRLNINMESEDEQSFKVEYAPESDFVMSSVMLSGSKEAEILNADELESRKSKFHKAFQPVMEFSEEEEKINSAVQVVGVGSGLTNTLQLTGSRGYIFFYPSGEKDAAIFVFATEEEIATLEIEPFTMEFERNFYRIEGEKGDLLDFSISRAKELYEGWLSK